MLGGAPTIQRGENAALCRAVPRAASPPLPVREASESVHRLRRRGGMCVSRSELRGTGRAARMPAAPHRDWRPPRPNRQLAPPGDGQWRRAEAGLGGARGGGAWYSRSMCWRLHNGRRGWGWCDECRHLRNQTCGAQEGASPAAPPLRWVWRLGCGRSYGGGGGVS